MSRQKVVACRMRARPVVTTVLGGERVDWHEAVYGEMAEGFAPRCLFCDSADRINRICLDTGDYACERCIPAPVAVGDTLPATTDGIELARLLLRIASVGGSDFAGWKVAPAQIIGEAMTLARAIVAASDGK